MQKYAEAIAIFDEGLKQHAMGYQKEVSGREARTEEENAISKQVHRGLLDRGFILSPRCSGFLSTANTEQEIDDLEIALTETLQETAV